ncbi:MAG: hypothetical protein ACI4HI_00475 [Lachnospiraceae bacterium]
MKKRNNIDFENLAHDVIHFCQEWGMWDGISIYTGGKRYSYSKQRQKVLGLEHVKVRCCTDKQIDRATSYYSGEDCNGNLIYKSYANPEHLFEMNYDGVLYDLLVYGEYEVELADLSDRAIKKMMQSSIYNFCYGLQTSSGGYFDLEEEMYTYVEDFMERRAGWDPMEFDSYEDYVALTGDDWEYKEWQEEYLDDQERTIEEFSTQEEYLDYLERTIREREEEVEKSRDWYWDFRGEIRENHFYLTEFSDVVSDIKAEFRQIFERYGLWYEIGCSWGLTAYRG